MKINLRCMSTRICKTCNSILPLSSYQSYTVHAETRHRLECKECRAKKHADKRIATPKADISTFALPNRCINQECKAPTPFEGAVFQFRNDTIRGGYRNVCNACYMTKKYYQRTRERKILDDVVAYRKHNAVVHLQWAHANPDNVKAQAKRTTTDPGRKFKSLKTYAARKGIDVVMEDAVAMEGKLTQSCHYCGYLPAFGSKLNGLDRVNSLGKYDDYNTVACCATCNNIKNAYDIDEFIMAIRLIHKCNRCTSENSNIEKRELLPAFGGRADLRLAKAKDKTNELSYEQQLSLWCSPCYLCGMSPAFGIDRLNSSENYKEDNCKPCCSQCNYMKKDLSYNDFIKHVDYIHNHTKYWVITDVIMKPIMHIDKKERRPVCVLNSNGNIDLVFPSASTVAKIMQVTNSKVIKALEKNATLLGRRWHYVEPSTYRSQVCHADYARSIITLIRSKRGSEIAEEVNPATREK